MNENPEVRFLDPSFQAGDRYPRGKDSEGPHPPHHRVLREQATYLYASANNSEAAKKAIAWRHELESLERAIPVLDAMSRKQRLTEKRHIERRLTRFR